MKVRPQDWPSKTESESKVVAFKLAPAVGNATVSSVTWASDPSGLTFTDPATADSSQTVQVTISGGNDGTTYVVSALCLLSDGTYAEPFARIAVREPE